MKFYVKSITQLIEIAVREINSGVKCIYYKNRTTGRLFFLRDFIHKKLNIKKLQN